MIKYVIYFSFVKGILESTLKFIFSKHKLNLGLEAKSRFKFTKFCSKCFSHKHSKLPLSSVILNSLILSFSSFSRLTQLLMQTPHNVLPLYLK